MNAYHLLSRSPRQIGVEAYPPGPSPEDGLLVRNEFTLISVGTEIYTWIHGGEPDRPRRFPRTTGYCNCGTVLAVGTAVTDVQPGQRVAGQGHHTSHGVMVKPYNVVPDGLPSDHAVFLTMAAIALHGIRVARVELGEAVAVLGLGLVGQFTLSLARLAGALPLIGIDLDEFRLQRARERGADQALNPSQIPDLTAAVADLCPDGGADAVLECTGIPNVYPAAARLPRFGGRLVAVGSPRGQVTFDFMRDIHLREVSLLGAFHPATPQGPHPYYPWSKERDRNLLLTLMAAGRLPVADLITHRAAPEACQELYTMLADDPQQVLGVLFDWRDAG